jgi:hypothetical protein
MEIATLKAFLFWCTILNGGLLIYTSVMCVFAPDWIYRMQSRWFPISREAFNIAIYSFLGLFKICFLVFNLVPYVALLIVA